MPLFWPLQFSSYSPPQYNNYKKGIFHRSAYFKFMSSFLRVPDPKSARITRRLCSLANNLLQAEVTILGHKWWRYSKLLDFCTHNVWTPAKRYRAPGSRPKIKNAGSHDFIASGLKETRPNAAMLKRKKNFGFTARKQIRCRGGGNSTLPPPLLTSPFPPFWLLLPYKYWITFENEITLFGFLGSFFIYDHLYS